MEEKGREGKEKSHVLVIPTFLLAGKQKLTQNFYQGAVLMGRIRSSSLRNMGNRGDIFTYVPTATLQTVGTL